MPTVPLRPARVPDQAAKLALLDVIINAVADPILMTDAEERILIANSRAEALLSANSAVSEGHRRAVEFNNMWAPSLTTPVKGQASCPFFAM